MMPGARAWGEIVTRKRQCCFKMNLPLSLGAQGRCALQQKLQLLFWGVRRHLGGLNLS